MASVRSGTAFDRRCGGPVPRDVGVTRPGRAPEKTPRRAARSDPILRWRRHVPGSPGWTEAMTGGPLAEGLTVFALWRCRCGKKIQMMRFGETRMLMLPGSAAGFPPGQEMPVFLMKHRSRIGALCLPIAVSGDSPDEGKIYESVPYSLFARFAPLFCVRKPWTFHSPRRSRLYAPAEKHHVRQLLTARPSCL